MRKRTSKTPAQAVGPEVSGPTAAACLRAELANPCSYNDPSILRDLMFLEAWENGQVPWLGAILRVRQIRRANPRLKSSEAEAD